MRKYFTIIFFLAICSCQLIAQQAEQYTMYMLNKYAFNPAYAGMDNSLSATGVYRKQWVGLTGSPSTQNVSIHMPFYYLHGGIGLTFSNDVAGPERTTNVGLSYNYNYNIGKSSVLSFSGGAGLMQKSIDGAKLRAPDGNYDMDGNVVSHNDPELSIILETAVAPTSRLGVMFKSESFEAGISADNLLGNELSFSETDFNFTLQRHYYFYLAYYWQLSDDIEISPSGFVKMDENYLQTDISILANYNEFLLGGVSLRGYSDLNLDAIAFIAGFKMNENLTLAYSYDLSVSSFNSVSQGSHEILINYNLNKQFGQGKQQNVIYNPRFL